MLWRLLKAEVRKIVAALRARRAPVRRCLRDLDSRRKVAPRRAEMLLLEYLSPEQRETYTRYGWFVVRGRSGIRYLIRKDETLFSNVCELGAYGEGVSRLCAHAATSVPLGDHLLTQKLMLEHYEAEFRRVANQTWCLCGGAASRTVR